MSSVGAGWLLAQVNIARPRVPLDCPEMGEFLAAVDPLNRLAEQSPGFVWRVRSDESHGTTMVHEGAHSIIVNLSVWESYEALHAFVYRSPHGAYLRRRDRWFEPMPQPSTGPVVGSGATATDVRRSAGPSPVPANPRALAPAFTLRRRFEPDGRPARRSGRRVG